MPAKTRIRTIMMSLGLAPLALCCTANAQPTELYFAEYQWQAPRINAVGLDGSNARELFSPPAAMWLPLGITFNAQTQKFVWMDSGGASDVVTAGTDGSGLTVLANPAGFCRGASLDAQGRVYFGSDNTVQRVNADGSGLETIYTSASSNPVGMPTVDATNGHVYIGAAGGIRRMDLDGGNVKTVVEGLLTPAAIGLDVANGFIYWIDANTQTDFIGRARLDGTDVTVLIDYTPNVVQSSGLIDLVVDIDGGTLYYADELTGQIWTAGLDGQNPTVIHTSSDGKTPSGLVLSTGEPVQAIADCNGNGIPDDQDIAAGAPDCDNNGVPDSCQANPCPQRTFLLDNGSYAADSQGRALGNPSQWQVFQPFDVPAGETWSVGEIGLDGFTVNYADGSGITARLFPDDGTGARPDETGEPLAEAVLHQLFNPDYENWVYAPMSASLEEGRYWVRIEANNPTVYGGSINHGFTGYPSLSRGSSGNFSNPAQPIALRIIEGEAGGCAADWDGDGVVNSGDISAFLTSWLASVQAPDLVADFNGDGATNSGDISAFLTDWLAAVVNGC